MDRPALTAEVEGMAALERRMRGLEPKLAKSALRAAVNAGAQVIKKEAKSLAPIDTGKLSKRAIYVQRSRRGSSRSREEYKVAVRLGKKDQEKSRDAFYWWYIEFGTKFLAARPFMRPAFEKMKFVAVEKIKAKLLEKLDKLTAGKV